MAVLEKIGKRIASPNMKIAFPEGEELEIIQAADVISKRNLGIPVLIGNEDAIRQKAQDYGCDINGVHIKPLPNEDEAASLAQVYVDAGGMLSAKSIRRKLKDPLHYGALLTSLGKADALVAGLSYSTQEVILASQVLIGLSENVSAPSSFFLMDIPNYRGPEENLLLFADCALFVKPNAEELADITRATAYSAKTLLGWEPRVALLSFSTKGSGEDESIDRILEACSRVRELDADIHVDGELQFDAAVDPLVAKKKVSSPSEVAGKANILIFPDLTSGNITYKAVQRLAGAHAYGPVLQGFARPVSDLSRGATVEDIVGAATIALALADPV